MIITDRALIKSSLSRPSAWTISNVRWRNVPFRLELLLKSDPDGIYLVEGENSVDSFGCRFPLISDREYVWGFMSTLFFLELLFTFYKEAPAVSMNFSKLN